MDILGAINPAEIVNQLFPNVWVFIAHLLATIVLLFLLSKWVYNPFRKAMRARRQFIQKKINEAVIKNVKASKDKNEAANLLSDAKIEASEIIYDAKHEAENKKLVLLNSAKEEINVLNQHAAVAIEQSKVQAQEDTRKSIVNLAFSAANNLLKEEIDPTKHKQLIDDFLKELD